MSLQAQPQQPAQVYPTPVTNQPQLHHSHGSFGAVFIVLAIILVISLVACFLGRLCNRRYNNRHSHSSQRPPKQQRQQIHNFHPTEGDIEFGVDKRVPVPPVIRSKIHEHHDHEAAGRGQQLHVSDNMKDFEEIHHDGRKPHGHGLAYEGEFRAGA
ncbi:hypothetical protein RJT34_02007 [Clitoria ternatea]|uniref:Uncharacterized protein n=1 Tax=Clitoria ternatea TaxID=43366 RepID=A0AAN9KK27_CLITE